MLSRSGMLFAVRYLQTSETALWLNLSASGSGSMQRSSSCSFLTGHHPPRHSFHEYLTHIIETKLKIFFDSEQDLPGKPLYNEKCALALT